MAVKVVCYLLLVCNKIRRLHQDVNQFHYKAHLDPIDLFMKDFLDEGNGTLIYFLEQAPYLIMYQHFLSRTFLKYNGQIQSTFV